MIDFNNYITNNQVLLPLVIDSVTLVWLTTYKWDLMLTGCVKIDYKKWGETTLN